MNVEVIPGFAEYAGSATRALALIAEAAASDLERSGIAAPRLRDIASRYREASDEIRQTVVGSSPEGQKDA